MADPEPLPAHLEAVAQRVFEQGKEIIDHAIAEAVAGVGARADELHDIAADMLASFTKSDAGYRARVGQVQVAKWRKVLDGEP